MKLLISHTPEMKKQPKRLLQSRISTFITWPLNS